MITIFCKFFVCCYTQQWILRLTLIVLLPILFGDLCSCDVYMQSQCGQTIHSLGERIYSQLSHQYQPSINCSITLKGQFSGQKIFLRIEDLDIKGTTNFHGDYLEVYDATGKPLLRTCGKPGGQRTKVTSSGDSLRLVFNTDARNNGRGFRAVFTALYPDKQCRAHHKYRCSNKRCISSLLTCDTVNHCGDGSDERPSACKDKKDEYKDKYKTVGETDVIIPELIFICIGSVLVMFFLYLCIPQFITHIIYVKGKWSERKELQKVLGSTSGSNRPSITSLRTRPSDAAFIPLHLEITMGELLKDPTNTLSLIRNVAPQGNDDRDKVIADAVSSGQKVKVGRFMVEKSLVQEPIEEEDEYSSDDDQYVPIRRREKRNIESDSDDDEKRSSWIERREAKISKNLQKEGLLDYSSEDSMPDGETLCWDEKEVLLKQRGSSISSSRSRTQSRPRAPSRQRSYSKRSIPPEWDLTDSDDPSSSQMVVRSRAATLPFKPVPKTPAIVPEWDFSSSSSSSSPSSSAGVIDHTGISQKPSEDLISFNAENTVGRFIVTTVNDTKDAHEITPSNQNSLPDILPNSDMPIKIGRFSVQKYNMDRYEIIENTNQMPEEESHANKEINPKRGRFVVSKVEELKDQQGKEIKQEASAKQGRFMISKVEEPIDHQSKEINQDITKQGRFNISKVEDSKDQHSKESNLEISDKPIIMKGRFSVKKVDEKCPKTTRLEGPNTTNKFSVSKVDDCNIRTDQKKHNSSADTHISISTSVSQPKRTGRFDTHKVDEPESVKTGSTAESSDELDIVAAGEKTAMLSGIDSECDMEDTDSNDKLNKGYLETDI